MPKKTKSRPNSKNKGGRRTKKTQLILKGDDNLQEHQLYGQVKALLGGKPAKMNVMCEDQVLRQCTIPGRMHGRIKAKIGSYVLVNYHPDSHERGGEIHTIYHENDSRTVEKLAGISDSTFRTGEARNNDSGIEFSTEANVVEEKTGVEAIEEKTLADFEFDFNGI